MLHTKSLIPSTRTAPLPALCSFVTYCIVLLVGQELSSLLRYPVGPAAGGRRYHTWVPLQEYMDREGNRVLSEARLTVRGGPQRHVWGLGIRDRG